MITRRIFLLAIATTGVAAAAAGPAQAQGSYPDKVIKMIVPAPAGGQTDVLARLLAQKIQQAVGQNVIIDNRPGAGGALGARTLAAAEPDGYTLFYGNTSTLAVIPAVSKNPGYDPAKNFAPIASVSDIYTILVVHPAFPANTVQELVAYAKANPGKVTYASTGLGSTNQLGAEFLAAEAGGLKLTHVPYRGGAPAIADVAAGNVDLFFANVSEIMGMARGGKVRVLALASSKPTALAPELPLLTKDIPALDINNWFGLVGPAGLPADIKESLAKLFLAAMADPANKETLDKQGLVALGQGSDAFAAYIKQDRERWAKVVKQGNIKAE